MESGYSYAPLPENVDVITSIVSGRFQFALSSILVDPEVLKSGPEPDIQRQPALIYIYDIWHALHANFDAPDGQNMLRLQSDELLQPLLAGQGFTSDMQGGVFYGFAIRPPDVRERAFVEALPFKVQP